MSQDELLAHIDSKLSVLDRPMALLKWLVLGGFAIGVWAATQQMTLAGLIEFKRERIIVDQRQDADIHDLERQVLTKFSASAKSTKEPRQ